MNKNIKIWDTTCGISTTDGKSHIRILWKEFPKAISREMGSTRLESTIQGGWGVLHKFSTCPSYLGEWCFHALILENTYFMTLNFSHLSDFSSLSLRFFFFFFFQFFVSLSIWSQMLIGSTNYKLKMGSTNYKDQVILVLKPIKV